MPPRRLLRVFGLVTLLVLAALWYRRETVEEYASQAVVGGGAVLRGKEQEPAAPLTSDPPPAPVKTFAPVAPPPTIFRSPLPALPTSSTAAQRPIGQLPVPVFEDELEDEPGVAREIGEGRLEIDTMAHPTTGSIIHWSSQPVHFPISEQSPISTTIQLPSGKPTALPRIQAKGKLERDKERLAVIKEAAEHAWAGYKVNAFGADEIKPISGGLNNPFNGWGATLVDSLDTLWIMGMKTEFEEAVEQVAKIDFTTSKRSDIPVFETTIRYVGGLIAAYDITDGAYRILLDKAVELAEILMSVFDTPNRMPITFYYWKPTLSSQPHRARNRVVLAEIGSLSLEFTRLAQLTGEPKYYDAIARITNAFEEWQNNTRMPGMWPTYLDASGCKKPAQMAQEIRNGPQQPLPDGSGTMMTAIEPVKVDADVLKAAQNALDATKHGTKVDASLKASLAAEQNVDANGKKVSIDPAGLTSMLDDREKADVAKGQAGKAGKIGNFGDPLEEGSLDNKGAAAPNAATVGNGQAGKAGTIGHFGDPLDEGSLDSKAAKAALLAETQGDSSKQKRQVDFLNRPSASDESMSESETPLNSTMHRQELRAPTDIVSSNKVGSDVCLPQGLASVSNFGTESYTLGGMSDSMYEYLPKEYMLLGGRIEQYRTMYEDAMDTVAQRLLYRPMTEDNRDILMSGESKMVINSATNQLAETFIANGAHLTCFAGGMFALGAKLFDRPRDLEIGAKLTDGCIWAYNVTASGIMPEEFVLLPCDDMKECTWNETKYWEALDPHANVRTKLPTLVSKTATPSATTESLEEFHPAAAATNTIALAMAQPEQALEKRQLDLPVPKVNDATQTPTPTKEDALVSSLLSEATKVLNKPIYTRPPPLSHKDYVAKKIADERLPPGFVRLTSRKYILRPEAIESVFYMYRITGNAYWREQGWNMFTAIQDHTFAPFGNSAIDDVTKENPEPKDNMESFWLAETLKYFWLLFESEDVVSLDQWVLNTEAHMFKRPGAKGAS